jgi:lipopolysaccharide transport system permease protein
MSLEIPMHAESAPIAVPKPRTAGEHRRHNAGLIWTLIRTDVKVYYHASLAGFLWALLRPLSMFVAIALVFALVFASQPNFVLNLIIGLFLYEFFSEGTKAGLLSLYVKGYLLTKTRFPFWIVVPSSSVNAIIILLVFKTSLLTYLGLSGRFPDPLLLILFVGYTFLLWLMILGLSLGMSALYLRFRDLNHIWDAILQAGFFITPVIYSLEMLPAHLRSYPLLWAPTPAIVYSRQVLIDGTVPSAGAHLYLLILTLLILGTGMLLFRHLARDAAEHL